jgi:hypothetical protein
MTLEAAAYVFMFGLTIGGAVGLLAGWALAVINSKVSA